MNRKILQIIKHLHKYFPTKHINVRVDSCIHVYTNEALEFNIKYSIYIEDFEFDKGNLKPSAWSKDCNSLNELIEYINDAIVNIPNWINIKTMK